MGLVPDGGITLSIGPAAGPRRASTDVVRSGVVSRTDTFVAASYGQQELSGFHPRLQSADAEVLPNRDKIVARSRWFDRNNGWARGGIDKRVDAVVGSQIWLRSMPDWQAMGMSKEVGPEWADDFSRQVQALWRSWANDPLLFCDVERDLTFGGMTELAYRHYILDGEATAPLFWIDEDERPLAKFATSVLIMDPDRLDNPDGKPDNEKFRGGIELDRYGAAVAYWCRRAHESDLVTNWDSSRFDRIARETSTGRPQFIHVFDKRRAGMRRGLGRLTTIMSRMKMLDRYDATEVQRAVAEAIFGIYAKTQRTSDDVAASLAPAGEENDFDYAIDEYRAGFYEESPLVFNGLRVAVLPDGDELDTIKGSASGDNFKAFQRAMLNSIASAFGLSGEQLSNDWEGINYSSARTLLNEIWRGLTSDRSKFTQKFCTPIYLAWLEEAVARELIEVPGGKAMFYIHRTALSRCSWIGPGRGYIDPLKEVQAAEKRINLGLTALPDEAAEQGNDWEDNLWDAKRVQVKRQEYGLPDPSQDPQAQANASDNPDQADMNDRQTSGASSR